MLDRLIDWVRKLFGIKRTDPPDGPDKHAKRYEDIREENITAKISNKLANFVFSDSVINVDGAGRRAELIRESIEKLMDDAGWITAQAFGKGGKVIVPTVIGDKIKIQAIDQNRMDIRRMDGGRILEATLVNDCARQDDKRFFLLADYAVGEDGTQLIRYRAVGENGEEAEKSMIRAWQNVADEIAIGNTDRVLFAFLPCPADNRRDSKRYGVPITYGAEREMAELTEHANIYRREYKLTRAMLGLDASLWSMTDRNIDAIKKTVQDGDDPFIPIETSSLGEKSPWMHFAPAIRYEAMEGRYNSLCRKVEKACGLSQGILTERQNMNYANKDEVRAAMYDTFCVVKAMRRNWEKALGDLAYAIDVLAERFSITPAGARGSWELQYDWDTSLIESTTEAFTQTMEGHAAGVISDTELRQWLRGGTIEEAEKALEEIRQSRNAANPIDGILNRMRAGGDEE